MAAHLRSIVRKCMWTMCDKSATLELRNTYNAVIGEYCAKHGQSALREFQRKHEGDTSS